MNLSSPNGVVKKIMHLFLGQDSFSLYHTSVGLIVHLLLQDRIILSMIVLMAFNSFA